MREWLPWIAVLLTIIVVGMLVGSEDDGYRPGEIDEYPPSVEWDEEEEDDAEQSESDT